MVIYALVDENGVIEGYGSVRGSENEIEIEVADDHPIHDMLPDVFKYVDGQIIFDNTLVLSKEKLRKNIELNRACSQSILEGFSHNIGGVNYWFSFDAEAQSNFQGTRPLLKEGLIPSINWTVRIGGKNGQYTRIPINSAIMDELTVAILYHKDNNISKYRDTLMPLVNSATTIEELEAIKW